MHTPNLCGAGAVTRAQASVNTSSIVRIVWQATLPKGCNKSVLACLAWHAVLNEADQCWPHVDTLARLCGLQRRATENNLKALAKAGLIATTQRPGTSNLYQLNRAALVALSSEQPAAAPAARGAENAQPPAENDTGGAEKAQDLSFSAPIRKKERREKEEGREREEHACAPGAAATTEPAFPPLPVSEDLKTAPRHNAVDDALASIAETRAAGLPLGGQDIRDLIEAAAASGEVPRAVTADALRFCLPAFDAPTPAEATEPAPLASTAEPTAAPAAARIVTPPAPAQPAPALAVAIAPDTLAAVNAQRVRNGKGALKPADLLDLHREATLASIAPQAAAEWILARPSRSFFRAGYGIDASPAPAQAAPIDQAAKARANADAVQAALLRRSIEVMRAPVLTSGQPSAQPPARTSPRTVTRCTAGVTALGGRVAGLIDNERVLRDYAAGRPFKVAQFEHALAVTGRSRAELRTQRASAKAGLAA